jgi:hypothetical protein
VAAASKVVTVVSKVAAVANKVAAAANKAVGVEVVKSRRHALRNSRSLALASFSPKTMRQLSHEEVSSAKLTSDSSTGL